jgi:hypothetical protein
MWSMKQIHTWGFRGLAIVTMLVSPVLVILSAPVAIGMGLDLFGLVGETPIVLALCAPLALLLLRCLPGGALRRAAVRLWSRLPLGHAADLIHAP